MQPVNRFILYIVIAAIIWIADALIFCLISGHSFLGAIWQDVSPIRLLFRLFTVIVLCFTGSMNLFRREITVDQYKKLNPASREHLFGDPDSEEREKRLQYHCLRLAAVLRMRRREQEKLRLLCFCYDIGETFAEVKGEVTHGHMDGWDRYQLDKHIEYGVSIARGIPQLACVAPLIAAHEENYDGSGPKGMFGRGIPLSCRIFRVVLLFDHFREGSAKLAPMNISEALDELDFYSGTLLDPDVVRAFRKLMSDQTVGESIMSHIYING